jgi:hypothetical protein
MSIDEMNRALAQLALDEAKREAAKALLIASCQSRIEMIPELVNAEFDKHPGTPLPEAYLVHMVTMATDPMYDQFKTISCAAYEHIKTVTVKDSRTFLRSRVAP